jgi:hypothetical protein
MLDHQITKSPIHQFNRLPPVSHFEDHPACRGRVRQLHRMAYPPQAHTLDDLCLIVVETDRALAKRDLQLRPACGFADFFVAMSVSESRSCACLPAHTESLDSARRAPGA